MTTKRGPTPKKLPPGAKGWLGKASDQWIANQFGCSKHTVARARHEAGIEPYPTCTVPPDLLAKLGVITDPELVVLCERRGVKITKQRLAAIRKAKGITACKRRYLMAHGD